MNRPGTTLRRATDRLDALSLQATLITEQARDAASMLGAAARTAIVVLVLVAAVAVTALLHALGR
jgi:hypothetical protein